MTVLSQKKSFFSSFPTPEYLLLAGAGLAITDESVKIMELERNLLGDRLKLAQCANIKLPEGVIQAGFINDANRLKEILSEAKRVYGLNYVYATLPEERAYLFSAVIDKVPEEGLRDAVAFILEENAPVRLSNSVFDFTVVKEFEATNQLKLTVAVLSRKVVEFYIEVLEAAGIVPVSFDIESQAIARAVVPRGDARTQLIVNLGENKTGFYVVEDEVVQFTTTVPYKASPRAPYPHLNELKNELRKVFAFWGTRPSDVPGAARKIEKAYLCGPGTSHQTFIAELMDECEAEYQVADPWINTPVDASHVPADVLKDSLDYAAVIGLAMPKGV